MGLLLDDLRMSVGYMWAAVRFVGGDNKKQKLVLKAVVG